MPNVKYGRTAGVERRGVSNERLTVIHGHGEEVEGRGEAKVRVCLASLKRRLSEMRYYDRPGHWEFLQSEIVGDEERLKGIERARAEARENIARTSQQAHEREMQREALASQERIAAIKAQAAQAPRFFQSVGVQTEPTDPEAAAGCGASA